MKLSRRIVIKNKQGLHARPAALFVQAANKYDSSIKVKKGGEEVNGKSIMGILMLAAEKGSRLEVTVEGEDADKALEELERLLTQDE
ncbi:MAG: HPr family phosphocarrier protein [Candidatus Omnitrophica bacterium]|nr:HPr family phosphocarrier protein [Candidatus Omnitrophota bacterium]